MAYNQQNFGSWGGSFGDPSTPPGPMMPHKYSSSVDTAAQIMTPDYGFEANIQGQTIGNALINVGDRFAIQSSDFPLGFDAVVSAIDSTTFDITLLPVRQLPPGGSATTFTTTAGSATQTFTLTGAKVGDSVILQPRTGSNYIISAYVSAANTVTALFNADPGTGIVVNYLWFPSFS